MISEVHNMDCMEFMATIPDKYFSLSIADPPYGLDQFGVSTRGQWKHKNIAMNGKVKSWDIQPDENFFKELFRISKNIIIWGGNYFHLQPCRCFICWDKMQALENFSQVEFAFTTFSKPAKIYKIPNFDKGKIHPTQKPTKLYQCILRTFAKSGDMIFDPMMGSQSSRIACYKMGFDFIGCEIDKTFFENGCKRFEKECLGIYEQSNGKIVKQLNLFEQ